MAGPWEKYGTQTKPANPLIPGQAVAQSLNNTGKSIDNQKAGATLPYDIRTSRAQAGKAELDLRQARIDAGLNPDTGKPEGADGPPAGITGEDFLKTLPAEQRRLVEAMSQGRLIPPTGRAAASPYWQKLIGQTLQYDPSFDAIDYGARYNTRKDFTSGQSSRNIKALNTAIGHVSQLADQIGGTASHGGFPLATTVNRIENAYSRGSGDSGITKFSQTAGAVASELTQVFRGTGGAEADVQRYLSELDPNASLDQKKAAVGNILGLLKSRLDALDDQYQKGMGAASAPLDVLDPHSKQALKKYLPGFDAGGSNPPPPPGGTGFTPPPSGPQGGVGGSRNGYSETPVPEADALWESAARQGLSYQDALKQYRADAKTRGNEVTVPPSPTEYGKAVDYMHQHPGTEYHPFQATVRKPLSDAGIIPRTSLFSERDRNDAAQTGTAALLGHSANQLAAGIPERLAGDQGAYFNTISRQQHPTLSTLGDIAGATGGAIGSGKLLGAVAPRLGTLGALLTKTPMRQALAGDALYGGTTGAVENPDHPIAGAASGAGSMLAGNAIGRFALGPALAAAGDTAAGQAVVNSLGRVAGKGKSFFSPPTPLSPEQSIILGRTGSDIGDIQNNLGDAARLNLPYALADAHPKLRLLAGSATRKSPDARTLAETVIGPRQLGQGERAVAQINSNLAPVGDVPTMKADTLKAAQAQSNPLYTEAKSQPVPELTGNPKLKEVLDRPAAQSAIRKGYETALNNGEDVGTLTYATDPNGNTVAYGNPSWNVIHYARRELDAGGETAVRQALDKQISVINPAFKKADAKYAGIVKGADALQAGADATGIKVTPEATQRALADFPQHGQQFQQGYASNMADLIERQRLAGNPYDLVNGSMGQQAKLGTIFPQGAANFGRAQALEGDMSKTAYETLGGSPTQGRAEADALFDSPGADAAADIGTSLLTGGIPSPRTLAKLGMKLGDLRALGLRGAKSKADALAPILLNPDPSANLVTLADLLKANAARQQYVGQARNLGGLIAAPTAFGLANR